MNGENRPLVTYESVEFEKYPVEVQDFGKIMIDESMEYTLNQQNKLKYCIM